MTNTERSFWKGSALAAVLSILFWAAAIALLAFFTSGCSATVETEPTCTATTQADGAPQLCGDSGNAVVFQCGREPTQTDLTQANLATGWRCGASVHENAMCCFPDARVAPQIDAPNCVTTYDTACGSDTPIALTCAAAEAQPIDTCVQGSAERGRVWCCPESFATDCVKYGLCK